MKAVRRVHVIVHGEVQGVNFRYYTAKKANELGINGFVRNLPERGVEVVAEGDPEKVEELLVFCRRGPSAATVTEAIVNEEKPKGEKGGFSIRY